MYALTETYLINDRVNRFFIEAVPEGAWDTKVEKGKSVAAQFAHIHNVRLMWMKAIGGPSLSKLEAASPAETVAALEGSASALASVIEECLASGKRVKGFKPSTEAFVGYLISHESHHRGQAELALRQAGVPIDDKASYGLWEWGSR
jgi:uncharacterized damage-inducible protein DinB